MFRVMPFIAAMAATACALAVGAPALSQDDAIDYGDDSSLWSSDGECDDPRFEGIGMASILNDEDRGHDATDCREGVEAGRLRFIATDDGDAEDAPDITVAPVTNAPDIDADIDYGDDSGVWANDGECDDPRFEGEGVAPSASRANLMRDAADCRAMVEAGRAAYAGELEELFAGAYDGIDFGDNAGGYPDDGECDDPRFTGSNVALSANRANAHHDAHDCREAYDAGQAEFAGELEEAFVGEADGVDFGDNSGAYPFDNECDDPRFSGPNVAFGASRSNVRGDADDCHRAYQAGEASYDGELPPLFEGEYDGVDFGDNSGPYVDDDECDDPRFSGAAMASSTSRANVRRDSHDCQEAYAAGRASYDGELEPLFTGVFEGVDFGNNEGPYADDGECDDRRFRGHGMARPPWSGDSEYRDAADCHALFAKGFIEYVTSDGLFTGRFRGIDFGDNSGSYVNDGECDDSRFEGPGLASNPDGSNDRRDAMDCKTNFEDGSIILKE